MFNGKIIWPVNVFDEKILQTNVLYLLGVLTRATGAEVQPVSVLHPQRARSDRAKQDFLEAHTLAEQRLMEIKANADISKMSAGKILASRGQSVKADVQALLNYAKSEDAGAIVVSTHARTLVPRFF
jgi:hypothetical protein